MRKGISYSMRQARWELVYLGAKRAASHAGAGSHPMSPSAHHPTAPQRPYRRCRPPRPSARARARGQGRKLVGFSQERGSNALYTHLQPCGLLYAALVVLHRRFCALEGGRRRCPGQRPLCFGKVALKCAPPAQRLTHLVPPTGLRPTMRGLHENVWVFPDDPPAELSTICLSAHHHRATKSFFFQHQYTPRAIDVGTVQQSHTAVFTPGSSAPKA
jgi:hypothetical protein